MSGFVPLGLRLVLLSLRPSRAQHDATPNTTQHATRNTLHASRYTLHLCAVVPTSTPHHRCGLSAFVIHTSCQQRAITDISSAVLTTMSSSRFQRPHHPRGLPTHHGRPLGVQDQHLALSSRAGPEPRLAALLALSAFRSAPSRFRLEQAQCVKLNLALSTRAGSRLATAPSPINQQSRSRTEASGYTPLGVRHQHLALSI